MKFNYGLEGLENVIKNYSIENDKIFINFFDGTHYEVDLTENNEQTLLNKMLEQAKQRRASDALRDITSRRKKKLLPMLSNGTLTILMMYKYVVSGSMVCFLGSSLGLLSAIDVGIIYKSYSDAIKELEKYDIYLSIYERLEKINDPNIFNGIDNGETLLNINTLDNYSLNEIKQIRKNLALCEKYYGSFELVDSDPAFVKKFSK